MMNINPAYPVAPHQHPPFGYAPSPIQRGGSAFEPHPQQNQQHVPPQPFQTPGDFPPPGYPFQPLVRPSPTPIHGSAQPSTGNGPMAAMSQPGLQPHVEASYRQYTASPYNQSGPTSSGPSSLSQPVSLSGSTAGASSSQQAGSMAAPAAPLSSNAQANNQQRFMALNGVQQPQGSQVLVQSANQSQNPSQSQGQPPASNGGVNAPLSPQSASRDKARVAVLLEINAHLLQDVLSLQAQGKAGIPSASQPQASPTHDSPPNSASTEHNPMISNNSPVDPSKPGKMATVEYVEDMKRLQANLAYLAAVADRNKRPNMPNGPALMSPPPHLKSMDELYKKLNALFSGGSAAVKANPTMSSINAAGQHSG